LYPKVSPKKFPKIGITGGIGIAGERKTEVFMETMFRMSVFVVGVKKRCRKVDRHHLNGGYMPYNDGVFDRCEVEQKARDMVDTNMKSANKIHVKLTKVEFKEDNGITIESFLMFDDAHVAFDIAA
jgi:hypothetical protein